MIRRFTLYSYNVYAYCTVHCPFRNLQHNHSTLVYLCILYCMHCTLSLLPRHNFSCKKLIKIEETSIIHSYYDNVFGKN